MKVDAHHHVWDPNRRPQPWLDASGHGPIKRRFGFDDLVPELDAEATDLTIVVQTLPVDDETLELLSLAAQTPRIGAVTGWVDLTQRQVVDRLDDLRSGPGGTWLRAIRHPVQGEPDDNWLRRASVRAGLAAVASHGLIFELLTRPRHLAAAVDTVRAMPQLQFVLDHASKPSLRDGDLDTWSADLTDLASLPNVTCKLSGFTTEADWQTWSTETLEPAVEHVLDVFGPERVMVGSDWPVCLLAGTYEQTMSAYRTLIAALSPNEQEQILGLTAARVYGLALDQTLEN